MGVGDRTMREEGLLGTRPPNLRAGGSGVKAKEGVGEGEGPSKPGA